VTKTTTAMIVAVFESPTTASDCVCTVEAMADYFISMQL
jgi:hypothetical protein